MLASAYTWDDTRSDYSFSSEEEEVDQFVEIQGVCVSTGRACQRCVQGNPCDYIGRPGHRQDQSKYAIFIQFIDGVCESTRRPCCLCLNGNPKNQCQRLGLPGHLRRLWKYEYQTINYKRFLRSNPNFFRAFIDGVCISTQKPCKLCVDGAFCDYVGLSGHLRSNWRSEYYENSVYYLAQRIESNLHV
jgi:hypothetical protein